MTGTRRGKQPSILVVANRLPYPLDDGWKRRTFHIVRGLAQAGPVTLVSLHAGSPEHAAALASSLGGPVEVLTVPPAPLGAPGAAVLGALTRQPYHVWRQRSRALRRLIASCALRSDFGVGLATLTHLYPYLAGLRPTALRFVDTHNIDSLVLDRYARSLQGPKALYARMTARKLRRHEADVFRTADRVIICSGLETAEVQEIAPGTEPLVVPNGVDGTGDFLPLESPPVPQRIVFFGKLDYYPNADAVQYFVRELFPAVRAEIPAAELHVVGPGASPALHDLARVSPGVTITGPVPDIRDTVGAAGLVVVPLRMGGGTRLKVLEALSLARPVVSTGIGAEGLALEPGRDLVIADEGTEFVREVVRLMRDPESGRTLGAAGRATVCRLYDWTIIERQIATAVTAALDAAR